MNIVMLIDSLSGGGAQRQFVNLAVGLFKRGHSVTVCSYHPHEFFASRLTEAGVPTHLFKKRNRFDLRPAFKLSKQIRLENADVVIAFLKTPTAYAEMAKVLNPRTPLIVSERCGVSENRLTLKDKLGYLGHLIATRVTTNSHDNLSSIVKAVPRLNNKISVIYNGVEEKFATVGKQRIEQEMSDPHLPTNNPIKPFRFCAIAARPTKSKGLFDLINAARLLRENTDNFTIDWIGPADKEDANVSLANQLIEQYKLTDHWRWIGTVKNTELHLPNYDAFILPSQVDGVANTLCEALSCALPVIATDIHDNREILKNGRAGLLCESENPQSMANTMQQLTQASAYDLYELSRLALQTAGEHFQMHQFLNTWENLCHEISTPNSTVKTK